MEAITGAATDSKFARGARVWCSSYHTFAHVRRVYSSGRIEIFYPNKITGANMPAIVDAAELMTMEEFITAAEEMANRTLP